MIPFMAALTPSSSFSVTLRLQLPNRAGMLAKVTQAIAEAGGNLGRIDLLDRTLTSMVRELAIDATSTEHAEQIVQSVRMVPEIEVLGVDDLTFDLHQGGKISVEAKVNIHTPSELAMAYTPGVGRVSTAIARNPELVYDLTIKGNSVGIVTDGSAVLGLGNIGPEAALPVMEGKAMLFKQFADIDAFPICLATQDVDDIVRAVVQLAPVYGGFNLEDISAPRCFDIESKLKAKLPVPVFHDDQHGTAIVVLAALLNAFKVARKSIEDARIVVNGAGAAGIAIIDLLKRAGATKIACCDRFGIISRKRATLTAQKQAIAVDQSGTLAEALAGADAFIGVSVRDVLTVEMVESMAAQPVVFALANPFPEIQPELVGDRVAVMATGRSDYANQINNVLAFPGVFRGALDCRAEGITPEMNLAAAEAIAHLVGRTELASDWIVPSVFDERVAPAVAAAVTDAARRDGVAKH